MELDLGNCLKNTTVEELAKLIQNNELSLAYCSSNKNNEAMYSEATLHHNDCELPCYLYKK